MQRVSVHTAHPLSQGIQFIPRVFVSGLNPAVHCKQVPAGVHETH